MTPPGPSLAELIGAGDFQWGYATNDLERATHNVGAALGITNWVLFSPELQAEQDGRTATTRMNAAFGVLGSRLIELCEPVDGLTDVFAHALPEEPSEFAVRFHHMGVRVPSIAQAAARLKADGQRFFVTWGSPGQVSVGFVDCRSSLGHFVELLEFTYDGWAFIDSLFDTHSNQGETP